MDTSTTSRLSAAWVGTAKYNTTPAVSVLKVAMSTGFAVNDTYLTSTVTLQNLLSTPLYNVSWMRSNDPDNDAVRSPSCFVTTGMLGGAHTLHTHHYCRVQC